MTAGLASIIAAGLLSSTAVAFGATANPDGSVTVESGDTLSAIAQQFGGDWRDYTGYRSGNPDLIFPGEHVRDTRKTAGTDGTECRVTIDWAAEAQKTYDGDYGVDPVRHDTLAARYGDEAADKVQELVNRMVYGTWAPGQDLPDGYESNECVVKAPAGNHSGDQSDGTAHQSSSQSGQSSTTQRHHATKVWIVDRDGHFEPVFQDVPVRHEAVTQTREHPAVTRTEKVKVRDAWDEKVTHPAEYKEVEHPAQTHVERVLVTPEHTVRHDAEYRDKVVVDKEAWTEKVKVRDAWTETVHHEAEYKEVTHPAQTHVERVVDVPEHTKTVHHEAEYKEVKHPAVTHTVNHPAVTHTERVMVSPAQPAKYEDKVIVDKKAWTETINHPAITHVETKYVYLLKDGSGMTFDTAEELSAYCEAHNIFANSTTIPKQVTVVDKEAWTESVRHPAVTHTERVMVSPEQPAKYEDKVVVDKEAWTETVVDKPEWTEKVKVKDAWDEQVTVPATYKEVTVVDQPARTEKVKVRDAYGEKVDHPAEYKEVTHPAVTHTERVKVKDAWTETIPARYEDRTVVDREAWTEKVKVKDPWTETVHHAAKYVDRTVVVRKAWTETIVVRQAWTETVRRETGRRWVEPTGHWEYR